MIGCSDWRAEGLARQAVPNGSALPPEAAQVGRVSPRRDAPVRPSAYVGNPPIADIRLLGDRPDMEAREALSRTLTGPAVRRSLVVAIVVGTALNLINQGAELVSGQGPVLWKLGLTYVVPFLVASYGTYAAFRSSP